jgi:hypothetical protein
VTAPRERSRAGRKRPPDGPRRCLARDGAACILECIPLRVRAHGNTYRLTCGPIATSLACGRRHPALVPGWRHVP